MHERQCFVAPSWLLLMLAAVLKLTRHLLRTDLAESSCNLLMYHPEWFQHTGNQVTVGQYNISEH